MKLAIGGEGPGAVTRNGTHQSYGMELMTSGTRRRKHVKRFEASSLSSSVRYEYGQERRPLDRELFLKHMSDENLVETDNIKPPLLGHLVP